MTQKLDTARGTVELLGGPVQPQESWPLGGLLTLQPSVSSPLGLRA